MSRKVKLSDEALQELRLLAERTAKMADAAEMQDVGKLLESEEFFRFLEVMSPELVMCLIDEIVAARQDKKWTVV